MSGGKMWENKMDSPRTLFIDDLSTEESSGGMV